MTGQGALDLPGFFERAGNPRTPAPPISYIQAARNWPGVAKPVTMSPVPKGFAPEDVTIGAMLLGFDRRPRRAVKRRAPKPGEQLPDLELLPQMIAFASVLEARKANGEMLYPEVVIEAQRRTAKTTSIWCTLLGRCMNNRGHKVAFTAQSGVKASEIFLDMATQLEREWAATHEAWQEPPFRVYRGVGHEMVKFDNDSIIRAYPPDPAAFRSAAADTVYIEEAQEHGPAKTEILLGGILPLMDTMDAPQVIIAGTPGLNPDGMLFDALSQGRSGQIGIVEFAVPVDDNGVPILDPDDPKTWDKHHPGIGTLTTAEIIAARHAKLKRVQFHREYCCIWPIDTTTRVIPSAWWDACRVPWDQRITELPSRYALAYDVAIDQSSAAVAIAWRDGQDNAHVEILAHDERDDWLARFLITCAVNGRNVPFGYDSMGNNVNVANDLMRAPRGRPRLVPFSGGKPTAAATANMYSLIKAGKLRHYDQGSLNDAIAGAGRRSSSAESTGWYWARKSQADVTPLVAATMALATYDRQPAGGRASFGSRRTSEQSPDTPTDVPQRN